jgi:hypothetical protein
LQKLQSLLIMWQQCAPNTKTLKDASLNIKTFSRWTNSTPGWLAKVSNLEQEVKEMATRQKRLNIHNLCLWSKHCALNHRD